MAVNLRNRLRRRHDASIRLAAGSYRFLGQLWWAKLVNRSQRERDKPEGVCETHAKRWRQSEREIERERERERERDKDLERGRPHAGLEASCGDCGTFLCERRERERERKRKQEAETPCAYRRFHISSFPTSTRLTVHFSRSVHSTSGGTGPEDMNIYTGKHSRGVVLALAALGLAQVPVVLSH